MKALRKINMRVIQFFKIFLCLFGTSCMFSPTLSRISPGYSAISGKWIAQSNGTPVQKAGLADGCSFAHTRETHPTGVRHVWRGSIDSEYLSDPAYKNAWQYGYYYCHINRAAFANPFLRGWNTIGFKGDAVSYKM